MICLDIAQMLGLDDEVISNVEKRCAEIDFGAISSSQNKLFDPPLWQEGLQELWDYCGDDPLGMKILTIMLDCLVDTYGRYMQKGISEKIFLDTMAFIPRFIAGHKAAHGVSAFVWSWWLPREISMNEFRVGEYEYEFWMDNGVKKLNLHIPSDANLKTGDIPTIYPFVREFYPEYADCDIVCDSWLLSPELKKLLPEDSNIIRFQNKFRIERFDEENPYFVGWVYPGMENLPREQLPENTTLQRNMKKYLIEGGKLGSAYGVYVG